LQFKKNKLVLDEEYMHHAGKGVHSSSN